MKHQPWYELKNFNPMRSLNLLLVFLGYCATASAQINCPQHLPLTLNGNTSYCIGTAGAALSVAETYDQYEWLPTAESAQNVLLTAGNYQLVVTHYTGCTDTLDFIVQQVSNPPQPTITASGPTEFCQGESVILSGPTGYPYYEWSSGSISEEITVFESITVTLSITDWIGCSSSSNSINVIVNPLPTALFSPDLDGFGITFNNLSLDASDYEWNFGDGNTSTDFEPTHTYSVNGNVDMYLIASNDCGSDTAFWELNGVSINENEPITELSVFPNPTSDFAYIKFTSLGNQLIETSLIDFHGRLIQSETIPAIQGKNQYLLNFEGVTSGTYLLHVRSGSKSALRKIMVNDL